MRKAARADQPNHPWHAVIKAAAVPALVLAFARAAAGDCFAAAGQRHGIAPSLLHAIAARESALDATAAHANSDGTRGIGVMQTHTHWLGPMWDEGLP